MKETSHHTVLLCNEDFSDFGTAFAILQEESFTYLLTCWHVIKEIGQDSLTIRGSARKATVVASDADLDLAVLSTTSLPSDLILNLNPAVNPGGKTFTVEGFHAFGKQIVTDSLPVKLVKPTTIQSRNCGEALAWHLSVADPDGALKNGFSGAPILDNDEAVVGVVIQSVEGKAGLAISIDGLLQVWPEAPAGLLERPEERRKRHLLIDLLVNHHSLLACGDPHLSSDLVSLEREVSERRITLADAVPAATALVHQSLRMREERAKASSEALRKLQQEQVRTRDSLASIRHLSDKAKWAIKEACETSCEEVSGQIDAYYTEISKSAQAWIDEFYRHSFLLRFLQWLNSRGVPKQAVRNLARLLSEKAHRRLAEWKTQRLEPSLVSLSEVLNPRIERIIEEFIGGLRLLYSQLEPEAFNLEIPRSPVNLKQIELIILTRLENATNAAFLEMIFGQVLPLGLMDTSRKPKDIMHRAFVEHVIESGVDLEAKITSAAVYDALKAFEALQDTLVARTEHLQGKPDKLALINSRIREVEESSGRRSQEVSKLGELESVLKSLMPLPG